MRAVVWAFRANGGYLGRMVPGARVESLRTATGGNFAWVLVQAVGALLVSCAS